MKRFTETAKWDDPWFRQLPGVQKLVFLYVIDRCNNAGFWEVDEDALAWHTKVDPKFIKGAWKGLERGIIGASGWVWVKRFLRHQKNDVLNAENPAHKQIIALIRDQSERFQEIPDFKEFIAPYKGLYSPIGKGIGKGTGKEGGVQRGQKSKPDSKEEVVELCSSIGLPKPDAEYFWEHWLGNGFTNDGKVMRDWKATIRSWKSAGHCPSQRPQRNGTGGFKPMSAGELERKNRTDREWEEAQERRKKRLAQQ